MELLNGRPADSTGRLEKEIRVYDLLDSLGISYQRVDHEPAMTIEACQDIDKLMGTHMCKNLFLCNRQETDFYLLLMPGDKKFKTKELSSQINTARLSFANETHMEELLDITPGSVSVMGLMNDKDNKVQLLIDEESAGASLSWMSSMYQYFQSLYQNRRYLKYLSASCAASATVCKTSRRITKSITPIIKFVYSLRSRFHACS